MNLKNIFKLGKKTKTVSSKVVDVSFLGKTQPAVLYMPYGMFANPANGNVAGMLADQGNEESLVALVFDVSNLEKLEAGEVAMGIPAGKARIYFRENGNITFKIGDIEGGDFAARFNELKSGFDQLVSDFNAFLTHVHGASGTPPVPPAVPSTASIDSAKIDEIEFPS